MAQSIESICWTGRLRFQEYVGQPRAEVCASRGIDLKERRLPLGAKGCSEGDTVFIHPQAIVETGAQIGARSRIWAFAHVLSRAVIGNDCNICDHTFIENDVVLGDRVTVKCGVYLWDGIVIEDDVFIGPNATFTNDKFPRSKHYPEAFEQTFVRRGASIGANATILPGVEIGPGAMVGAGAVVTRSVPTNAIVVGNPGKIVAYVDDSKERVER